jgi:DNA-3-methyladenine glycosylase
MVAAMELRRLRRDELPVGCIALARSLIGCVVVRALDGDVACGRIVEVEAYPHGDPASHAYRGRTARNASMFAPPHRAYVYLIYGTAHCLNVTSDPEGRGAAVLVRALEPIGGIEAMRRRRTGAAPRDLCRGPGRLCAALAIDRTLDGIDLLDDDRLWLAAPQGPRGRIVRSPRIGITRAADRLLRFYEEGNPFVSGPRVAADGTAGRRLDRRRKAVL